MDTTQYRTFDTKEALADAYPDVERTTSDGRPTPVMLDTLGTDWREHAEQPGRARLVHLPRGTGQGVVALEDGDTGRVIVLAEDVTDAEVDILVSTASEGRTFARLADALGMDRNALQREIDAAGISHGAPEMATETGVQSLGDIEYPPEPGHAPPDPDAPGDLAEKMSIEDRVRALEADFRSRTSLSADRSADPLANIQMDSDDPRRRAMQSDQAVARLVEQLQDVTAERDALATQLSDVRGELGQLRAIVTQVQQQQVSGRPQAPEQQSVGAPGITGQSRDPLGSREVYDQLRAIHGYEASPGVMEMLKTWAGEHKLAIGALLVMIMGLGIPVLGALAAAGGIGAGQHLISRFRSDSANRKKLNQALAKARLVAQQMEQVREALGSATSPEQRTKLEETFDDLRRDMATALDGVAQAKGERDHMDGLGLFARRRLARDKIRAGKALRARNITEKNAARIARSVDAVDMHKRSGQVIGNEWLQETGITANGLDDITLEDIDDLGNLAFGIEPERLGADGPDQGPNLRITD